MVGGVKYMSSAKEAVNKFFNLLCVKESTVNQFEQMIQSSYKIEQDRLTGQIDTSAVWDEDQKKFVSNKDRTKPTKGREWLHQTRLSCCARKPLPVGA